MHQYNFKTGEYENTEGEMPVERITDFIPQDAATQGIYRCRIGLGDTPLQAQYEALKANLEAAGEVIPEWNKS